MHCSNEDHGCVGLWFFEFNDLRRRLDVECIYGGSVKLGCSAVASGIASTATRHNSCSGRPCP